MTPKHRAGADRDHSARFRPIKPSKAADALRGMIRRLRTPWRQWPWPARIDHVLGTRPIFELLVDGPKGDTREWFRALRIVFRTTFLTPQGRAYLRWHWDYVHNGGGRPELRRKLNAHTRLSAIKSRYWLQPWYLDDELDQS